MKNTLSSNRSKALIGIAVFAIGVGVLAKKTIGFPSCSKGGQEVTFLNFI